MGQIWLSACFCMAKNDFHIFSGCPGVGSRDTSRLKFWSCVLRSLPGDLRSWDPEILGPERKGGVTFQTVCSKVLWLANVACRMEAVRIRFDAGFCWGHWLVLPFLSGKICLQHVGILWNSQLRPGVWRIWELSLLRCWDRNKHCWWNSGTAVCVQRQFRMSPQESCLYHPLDAPLKCHPFLLKRAFALLRGRRRNILTLKK